MDPEEAVGNVHDLCVCVCRGMGQRGLQTRPCLCCMVQLGKDKVLAGARTTAGHNEYVPLVRTHERARSAGDSAHLRGPLQESASQINPPEKAEADPCGNQGSASGDIKKARRRPAIRHFLPRLITPNITAHE